MRALPSIGRAVSVVLAFSTAGPASAATRGAGTLADPATRVTWEGRAGPSTALRPEACPLLSCDEFKLRLELPAGTWRRPGGLQIGVRWGEEGQDIDLYVYGPDDPSRLAASSTGTPGFSAALSVVLRNARNGSYRIVVAPFNVTKEGGMAYRAIAEVEREPAAHPVRELLPNLVSLPPRTLRFATGSLLLSHRSGRGPQLLSRRDPRAGRPALPALRPGAGERRRGAFRAALRRE